MTAEQCIQERRSVRKFAQTPVPHAVWEKIVELARFVPSWKNTQAVRYHVVESAALRENIAADCVLNFAYNAKTIRRCAGLVVLTIQHGLSGCDESGAYETEQGGGWEHFDAGVAAQTFCLAAHTCGVGTVILGIFDAAALRGVCAIPADETIAALIAVGYPEQGEAPKAAPPRKSVAELLHFAPGRESGQTEGKEST